MWRATTITSFVKFPRGFISPLGIMRINLAIIIVGGDAFLCNLFVD